MWKWLQERLAEPSTYGGLAAATYGIGQLAKINEAPAIADAVGAVGQAVASGADPVTAGVVAVSGLVAVLLKEKAR